jgi:hypothetical protein
MRSFKDFYNNIISGEDYWRNGLEIDDSNYEEYYACAMKNNCR